LRRGRVQLHHRCPAAHRRGPRVSGQRDFVIGSPFRSAVGGFGGSYIDVPAHILAATLIRELLKRVPLPAELIDDVILGNCYPSMEAPAIGRVAALDAGLPITVTGSQL